MVRNAEAAQPPELAGAEPDDAAIAAGRSRDDVRLQRVVLELADRIGEARHHYSRRLGLLDRIIGVEAAHGRTLVSALPAAAVEKGIPVGQELGGVLALVELEELHVRR